MAQIPRKYLEAQSVEEIAEFLKEDGKDVAKAERTWEEICYSREQLGSKLSLDELDAVAGGTDRDWYAEGCAATVEPGSDCLGTDGGCSMCNVDYSHGPCDTSCIFCGARYTHAHGHGTFGSDWTIEYACRACHRWFAYDKQTGQMVEMAPRW